MRFEISGTVPTARQIAFFTAALGKLFYEERKRQVISITMDELIPVINLKGSTADGMTRFCEEMSKLCIIYFNYKRHNRDRGIYVFKRLWWKGDEKRIYAAFTMSAMEYFKDPATSYYKCKLTSATKGYETMKGKTYVLDTETTGLDCTQDEILQVSLIDLEGNVVYDKYFKPKEITEWKDAEAVNGISPEMVKDAPCIDSERDTLNGIFAETDTIIGYNTSFDIQFLWSHGIKTPTELKFVDVMQDFAPIYGEWSEKHNDYKYKSLGVCAQYYGFDWNSIDEKAHNSLGDCYATLHCYKEMNKTKEKEQERE